MDRAHEAVASTGLLVAAIRALESTRDDRLFTDSLADKLAGDTGRALLAAAIEGSGERSTVQIVVRTRFFDDALLRAARVSKQVVLLAAGMDSRAYRLDWPDGTTVYELDQPAVIAAKADRLADDRPRVVGARSASTWPMTGPARWRRRVSTRSRRRSG
jgi:methyltransferase (TIGR00027 family)